MDRIDNILNKSAIEKLHIKKNTKEISIKNKLIGIESNVFIGFDNLETLVLEDNSISEKKIAPDAFKHLTKLQDIDLSKNKIVEINENSFDDLTRVKKIGLNSNKIKIIKDLVFKDLSNLTQINLEDNEIPKISENTFKGLFQLNFLYLSQNKIEEIHEKAFCMLKNIIQITLKNNLLKQIHPDIFRGLMSLVDIQLHGNPLNLDRNKKINLCLEMNVMRVTFKRHFFGKLFAPRNDIKSVNNTVINNRNFVYYFKFFNFQFLKKNLIANCTKDAQSSIDENIYELDQIAPEVKFFKKLTIYIINIIFNYELLQKLFQYENANVYGNYEFQNIVKKNEAYRVRSNLDKEK